MSVQLRRSGDRLWDSFFELLLTGALERRVHKQADAERSFEEGLGYLNSAKFLYGLAFETALKAHLLRTNPSAIDLRLTMDGAGAIQSVEMKQFGVAMGTGHNLEHLADKAGLLLKDGNEVFKADSDIRAMREILRHLSEVVYWSGRYPIPTKSGEGHQPASDVPARVFGHYIRDWIDPALNFYQGAHASASKVERGDDHWKALVAKANASE